MWIETIRNIDERLFWFLNLKVSNPFFDAIMPLVTDLWNFAIPLGIAATLFIVLGEERQRKFIFLFSILIGVILTDQSTAIIKDIFQRVRPCNTYEGVRLLVGCTGSFSMPSAHAANIFFVSTVLSYFYKKLLLLFLTIALTVSFSRIYVGVHYPGDVLVGGFLGFLFATIFILLYQYRQIFFSTLTGSWMIGGGKRG